MKKVGSWIAAFCMVLTLIGGAFAPTSVVEAADQGMGIPDYVNENGEGFLANEGNVGLARNANAAVVQELEGGPSVETLGVYTCFFANGTPVTVSQGETGSSSTKIIWEEGEYEVADGATLYVFGGSHDCDEIVESAEVTVNGGLIHILSAGGLHKSHTVNSTVTVNGGQVTNLYAGGIGFGHNIDSCPTTQDYQDECVLEHANVDVNGGILQAVYGGGMAYQRADETRLNLSEGQIQQFLVMAGANGTTGDSYVYITGEMFIGTVYGAARGTVNSLNLTMDGGLVFDLFVGTDGYAEDNAKIGRIQASVTGGTLDALEEVYFGGVTGATEEELLTKTDLEFYHSVIGSMPDSLLALLAEVSFHIGGETYSVSATKGTSVDAYHLDPNPGYVVDGWYTTDEHTEKWDFLTPVEDDLDLYANWKEGKISTAVLEYALELAKGADTTGVFDSIVEKFNAAILNAEEILAGVETGDVYITQEVVDASWQELVTLMQYLSFKPGDKTDLGKIIAFARTMNLKEFLEVGQDEFAASLSIAQTVYDDEYAMQTEIDDAGKALLKALSELRRIPDKDALKELLEQANSLAEADYEAAGFAVLRTAVAQAEAVVVDTQATKEEVTMAEDGLTEAMVNLVLVSADETQDNEKQGIDNTSNLIVNAGEVIGQTDGTSASAAKASTATTTTTSTNVSAKSAKTGDEARAAIPAGMAAVALTVAAAIVKHKKVK